MMIGLYVCPQASVSSAANNFWYIAHLSYSPCHMALLIMSVHNILINIMNVSKCGTKSCAVVSKTWSHLLLLLESLTRSSQCEWGRRRKVKDQFSFLSRIGHMVLGPYFLKTNWQSMGHFAKMTLAALNSPQGKKTPLLVLSWGRRLEALMW